MISIMSFFISSFIINFLITKFLIKHSFNLNLIDHPENRKMHTNSMPVVGGLSIFITFSGFYLFWLYSGYLHTLFTSEEIISITISTLIIFLIGLMDDSFGLGPFNKFLFQFIAAIIFMIGLEIDSTHIFPFIDSFFFNFIINIFFVVGITNAFNLLDGLDGLAGGVSLIICFTLFILYLLLGYNIDQLILFIILLGCLSSFLFYNKTPAKTFLGDTGSLFLGWYFAVTSIYFAEKTTLSLSILLPFMILGLPAFDVLFVMISRFIKRHNYDIPFLDRVKLIFKPDNTHLHHLLLRGGLSRVKAVVILYFVTLVCCFVCILFWINRSSVNFIFGITFILLLVFSLRSFIEYRVKKRKR